MVSCKLQSADLAHFPFPIIYCSMMTPSLSRSPLVPSHRSQSQV